MSNMAFDRLCAAQDHKRAKELLTHYQECLSTIAANDPGRDYLERCIADLPRQIEVYKNRMAWG